jgi:hypothetical protein
MRKIIVLVCAIALMASVIPATASAHWLTKGEAANAIDEETANWLTFRPARRNCVRFSAHKVKCVVEHYLYDCIAGITVTLRGNTIYVGYPVGRECF